MGWKIINNRRKNMIYADVQHGKVSDFIITLMTQTKAKKIRAGFIKKDGSYRVGKFDLKHRKTWKQLTLMRIY